MNKLIITILLFVLGFSSVSYGQQQVFNITDSIGANENGLYAGYKIIDYKEKEVGDKGNFGRYSIDFYVTNTAAEAKIILYKDGFVFANDASPYLVNFNITNATGARFTNKQVSLQADACTIIANVNDKDCASGKQVNNRRFVQIGYWIKPGQTIKTRAIVIVPLNQKPAVVATLYPLVNSIIGSASLNDNIANYRIMPTEQPNVAFVKLKNAAMNGYLNNQKGQLACGNIDQGWWSAQWSLLPLDGTDYVVVKNKWQENFISTEDRYNLLSTNNKSQLTMWMVEPVQGSNRYFRLRNVGDNSYLNFDGVKLLSTPMQGNSPSAQWSKEY